jgi:hypothetical protein
LKDEEAGLTESK